MRGWWWLVVCLAGCGDSHAVSHDGAVDVAIVDGASCPPGLGDCDGNAANGCEQPLDTPDHCGACATACGSADSCAYASCGTPGVYACIAPQPDGTCDAGAGDSDGDGLLDAWELAGYIDINCNGVNDGEGIDVQLPGAHVDVPDVYLELDYMQQPGSGAACTTDATCQAAVPGEQCVNHVCTHTHAPKPSSLAAVQAAAQRGLPADPTRPGFYLHLDDAHGGAIAETPVVAFDTSNPACVGPSAVSVADVKRASFYSGPAGPDSAFAAERRRVYHYAIFGHYAACPPDPSGLGTYCNACATDRGLGNPQPGETGTAETPGNDLIVSLGGLYFGFPGSSPRPRSDLSEGGTLMHELGHNLFLGHGVTQTGARAPAANGPLWSPIYFSVMNYNYQTRGVLLAAAPGGGTPVTSKLDYSDVDGCADLNEAALDESVGAACGASTSYVVAYDADAGGGQRFASAQTGTPIDWNGDGAIAVAPDNLNRIVDAEQTEVFRSLNDWAYDASTHRFTTLRFDSSCYQWTLLDGVAPAEAMATHELAPPDLVAPPARSGLH